MTHRFSSVIHRCIHNVPFTFVLIYNITLWVLNATMPGNKCRPEKIFVGKIWWKGIFWLKGHVFWNWRQSSNVQTYNRGRGLSRGFSSNVLWQSFILPPAKYLRFELKRIVAEFYTASCKGLGVHPFQGFWAQLGLKDCLQILKQHEFCSAGRNLSQMVDI